MQNRGVFNTLRLIPRDTLFLDRLQGSRGEIFYDKQTNTLRLFDSQTLGGYELAKNDLSNVSNADFLQKAQLAGVGGGTGSNFDLQIASDDSTARTVQSGNIIQFTGGTGISTSSTTENEIIITNTSSNFTTIAVAGQSNIVADSVSDTLTLVAGTNVTITTNASTDTVTISAAAGASTNSFSIISVAGQNNIVADSATDTLTLVAGSGISITTNDSTDTLTITNNATSNFSALTDAISASLAVDKIYLPAITRLTVTNVGASAYRFDQYSDTNNPTIYAINATTIAFGLQATGHPFLIQTGAGTNYNTGLVHVADNGTVSTDSAAQGKDSGTLYWKIPSDISGNYRYQCGSHGAMVGIITIKNFSSI